MGSTCDMTARTLVTFCQSINQSITLKPINWIKLIYCVQTQVFHCDILLEVLVYQNYISLFYESPIYLLP